MEAKQAMRTRETVCPVQVNLQPLLPSDCCSDATKVFQQFSFFSYAILSRQGFGGPSLARLPVCQRMD
jgi:hypothetical protein